MKFAIKNRWSGAVQFEADIECDQNARIGIKVGLAVKWAIKTRADLTGADLTDAVLTGADLTDADLTGADLTDAVLTDADLTGADLTDADLTGADLTGADLTGAVLTDAVLDAFKADFWMTLTKNRNEVPGLIAALREGRVDGSTYTGECACLVGTIANLRHVPYAMLDHNSSAPAECWFATIKKGDKPGVESGGGFAAQKALEWALEWCALSGVEAPILAEEEAG